MAEEKGTEVARRPDGTFPKGVSGNPAGRPKGRRNEITLLKESLELELREQGASRMPEILDTAIQLALAGDTTMIKLLLELHMTKGGTGDVKAGQEKVTINIKGPSDAERPIIDITPDEGESS
jgi:hypothetical protein